MESLKKKWHSLPLRRFFILTVSAVLLAVALLSGLVIWGCSSFRHYLLPDANAVYLTVEEIWADGSASTGVYLLEYGEKPEMLPVLTVEADGIPVQRDVESINYSIQKMENSLSALSPKRKLAYQVCGITMVAAPTVFAFTGILLCILYFYRQKLKQPISLLSDATDRIAKQDLDFELTYDCGDEMGDLCRSFEEMRKVLYENNKEMWSMLEERRLMQASVAHDLHNPIAIIEGYAEYLENGLKNGEMSREKTRHIAQNLGMAAKRLEGYTESVRLLNCTEETELNRKNISAAKLADDIAEDLKLLSEKSGISLKVGAGLPDREIQADAVLLYRVLENIMGNALRYAKKEICLDFALLADTLSVTVTDDGKGFPDEVLRKKEKTLLMHRADGHMGIGLAISRLLCKKHGGSLELSNGAGTELRDGNSPASDSGASGGSADAGSGWQGDGLKFLCNPYSDSACYTENGYYYQTFDTVELADGTYGSHLMYMDYASCREIYLCSTAGCRHDSPDCPAVLPYDDFPVSSTKLFVSGDHLYILSREYDDDGAMSQDYLLDGTYDEPAESQPAVFYQAKLDGTERKKIYTFLPAGSFLSAFKYLNPVGLMKTENLYGGYLDFNLFGYPVSRLTLSAVCILLISAAGIACSTGLFSRAQDLEVRKLHLPFRLPFVPHTNIWRHEGYKMDQLEGGLTDEKEELILAEQTRYEEAFRKIERLDELVSVGEMSEDAADALKYREYITVSFYPYFLRVEEQYRKIKESGGSFVYDTGYLYLLGAAENVFSTDFLILSVGVILAVSGVVCMEYDAGALFLIGATKTGRRGVFARKFLLSTALSLALTLVPIVCRGVHIASVYPMRSLSAPVQSIPYFSGAAISFSICDFLIIFALSQLAASAAVTAVTLALSVWRKNQAQTVFFALLILTVPLILALLGFDAAKWFSVYPVYAWTGIL